MHLSDKNRVLRQLGEMAHVQISQLIPAPRFEAFDYLADPANLAFLLKPNIEVQLKTDDVPLKRGAEYHFLMTRYGLSQSVRLRVEDLLRGSRLTYRQVEGLFLSWTHTMRFEEHGEDQTLVTDVIDYQLPFGLIGFLADDLIVRRDMSAVLEGRLQKAKEHFSQGE